jgi:hypothetical protein
MPVMQTFERVVLSCTVELMCRTPSGAVGKDNMLYASQRRALDGVITGVDDAQCSSTQGVAKLLGISSAIEEDEEEWDPDA